MKIAVIIFPGSNCDQDVCSAIKNILNIEPVKIWHNDYYIPSNIDIIVLPGGFSYGDYLRTGAIAAHSSIMHEVIKAAEYGKYIIGICNGFQILTESKLLPGCLVTNNNLKFICNHSYLKVKNNKTVFSNNYISEQIINIPIAHKSGNYFASNDDIKFLQDNDSIVFEYASQVGVTDLSSNPNGSMHNIAGISNKQKNVLGIMPHPERAIDELTGSSDGIAFFKSLMNNL